jgi:hypothetical protein
MNYKKDSEASGGQMTLFSLEASLNHANHTPQQENDLAKKMRDTSGRKCLEQLKKFPHVGLWAKTFSDLLIGQEGWFSTRCKLTWKLKGTKYNRMFFQLYPSTLHTEGTEFGLLPTPNAMDWNTGTKPMTYQKRKMKHQKKSVILQMTLRQMAADLTPNGVSTYHLKTSFAEKMMGFPTDWTLLPFLNGEKKA